MTTPNDKLNIYAINRFDEIKAKLKWDLGNKVVQSVAQERNTKPITITQDKFDEMLDAPLSNYSEEERVQMVAVCDEADFVDNSFKFIDSLELPNNLARAIALIISGAKTGDRNDLEKAIVAIEGGFNGNQRKIN